MPKNKLINFAVIISAIIIFFSKFVMYEYPNLMFLHADDYFYYLKTVQNAYELNSISFDGIHATNGFHPLWFFVNYLIVFVTNNSIMPILYLVALVQLVASFLTYIFAYKLIKEISFGDNENFAILVALGITIVSMNLMIGAMEPVLSLPLLIYSFYYLLKHNLKSTKEKLIFGFICSLVVLSRLDSMLLYLLLGLFLPKYKNINLKGFAIISLGAFLLAIYLIFNLTEFGLLLPVSGMAKQLKTDWMAGVSPFGFVFSTFEDNIITGTIPFLTTVFASFIFFIKRKVFTDKEKLLIIPALIFPFLFIIIYAINSGWPLWYWYHYIFTMSFLLSLFIIKKTILKKIPFNNILNYLAVSFLILWQILVMKNILPSENYILQDGIQIAEFAKNHKGNYAMGDRAGIVGFLIKSPVVHTEGLIMNKEYLDDIKNGDLDLILKKYDIDYYIAGGTEKTDSGWYVQEPIPIFDGMPFADTYLKNAPLDSLVCRKWSTYIFKIK